MTRGRGCNRQYDLKNKIHLMERRPKDAVVTAKFDSAFPTNHDAFRDSFLGSIETFDLCCSGKQLGNRGPTYKLDVSVKSRPTAMRKCQKNVAMHAFLSKHCSSPCDPSYNERFSAGKVKKALTLASPPRFPSLSFRPPLSVDRTFY